MESLHHLALEWKQNLVEKLLFRRRNYRRRRWDHRRNHKAHRSKDYSCLLTLQYIFQQDFSIRNIFFTLYDVCARKPSPNAQQKKNFECLEGNSRGQTHNFQPFKRKSWRDAICARAQAERERGLRARSS